MSLLLAALLLSPIAADVKSGPQVGSTLPGPFEPLNLNGPDAGDECCLFCKYGNNPVVMVFASKPSRISRGHWSARMIASNFWRSAPPRTSALWIDVRLNSYCSSTHRVQPSSMFPPVHG